MRRRPGSPAGGGRRLATERVMAVYGKYTTTVVGAHSVPRWYEALEQLVEAGVLSKADMTDAQYRATQAAIQDQEVAGIDIITGGEMHRRTNNRYAPPNAMLNFFWQKIPAFRGETRPKPITVKDPNVCHPASICRGPIGDDVDLGLVDEYQTVRKYARREVKVTMTGPHMLAKAAYDEHYGDISKMMLDLGKLMHRNFRRLQEAGCRHIQIDEPLFIISDDEEVRAAVEAINLATEGLTMHVQVHVCQGNYAVGVDYDGQLGHRYFDTGRYPAELICGIACAALLIEHDMTPHYEGLLGDKQLAVGAADVQDLNVETPEIIAERIMRYRWLAPEQTLITSSCGMNHLPRQITFAKLRAITGAKQLLSGHA
jgi:5-methyltetrahydropteroyltriglutamate--homocysteine methyltransferase